MSSFTQDTNRTGPVRSVILAAAAFLACAVEAVEARVVGEQLRLQEFHLPHAPELLLPLLEILPLQLFAYYMTVKKGLDVDRPRNLVKSVTLE